MSSESSGAAGHGQSSGAKKKIPIGVFDPVYDNMSLDQMLDTMSGLGMEAVEVGTGGPRGAHEERRATGRPRQAQREERRRAFVEMHVDADAVVGCQREGEGRRPGAGRPNR